MGEIDLPAFRSPPPSVQLITVNNLLNIKMETIFNRQKLFFNSNSTKDLSFRLEQLRKLKTIVLRSERELTEAVFRDFHKGTFNTFLTEFAGVYVALDQAIKKLRSWAKPKRVKTNMLNFPANCEVIPEPLGSCLIIGSWNYPINLTLVPAIAAIAAGNTVVLKPSELTTHTNAVLAKVIRLNFDPSFLAVVEGGVAETRALLNLPFDKIFFTGSIPVGKIVYQAAAKNLTPVTLELGGKSPVIVAPDANLKISVQRLVWGKFLNAGQTCIAPDYILVHEDIKEPFLQALKAEIESRNFSLENDNYAQVISDRHHDRLVGLIEPGKVYYGGHHDRAKRFIEPTILTEVSPDDKVMEDEIFGPILPVLTYRELSSAIALIKSRPKPLSVYLFSESADIRRKILSDLSFGGGAINDVVMHFTNEALPFGGVGHSGIGSYHGEAGFKAFTHYKSIVRKGTLLELPLKYYPYKRWKFIMIKKVLGL